MNRTHLSRALHIRLCLCAALLFCARAHAELDRGHRILLERGLQVQSQVFSRDPAFSDIALWQSANFTTVNFQYWQRPDILEQMPSDAIWGRWTGPGGDWRAPPQLSADEMNFVGNLVSLQYQDEQRLTDDAEIAEIAAVLSQWRTDYPDTLGFINHRPDVPGNARLRLYIETAQPDMVMFDYYPYLRGAPRSRRYTWYQQSQRFRELALLGHDGSGNRPIPYGQYLSLFRRDYSDPINSESQVRLNQFVSWAMGYTFVSAFVYNDPIWHPVYPTMFASPGESEPTDTFHYVAETNRQSRNLGPALVRLLSTDVRILPGQHYSGGLVVDNITPGNIPLWDPGADPYIAGLTVTNDTATNGGLADDIIVGYFEPLLPDNPEFEFVDGELFMIVNGLVSNTGTALDAVQTIRMDFDFGDSGYNALQRLSRLTGDVELVSLAHDGGSLYHLYLELDGGTGDLFRFYTFIPEPGTLLVLALTLLPTLRRRRRR